jgi:hypothetical protein
MRCLNLICHVKASIQLTIPDSLRDTEVALISFVPTILNMKRDPHSSSPETKHTIRVVLGREDRAQQVEQVWKY